ncbi:MAG: hypothetical protein JSS09_05300 [Verrucomicrobia bacterium]|nr:hypothetical protein [Verrucomicrobiota bacterium]
MSLSPLLFPKKTSQDLKAKQEIKDQSFQSPLKVNEDKKEEKHSLDLLLQLCKKGLINKIFEEKSSACEDSEEEPSEGIPSFCPFISSDILSPLQASSPIVESLQEISSVATIPEECLQIIDKLCSEMLVMDFESCITTTFVLETQNFANSPFYGAKITISEYCTAPKIFNVSISAEESAITLLQTHMTGFFELLETRNFSFAIHKIDTHLSTDSWYKGKEKDQDEQEQEES